jgi:hypothetical protein
MQLVHTSGLTSAQRLLKQHGSLVAVPFYVKRTGYKARTAYGFHPVLQDETCALV